MTDLVERWKLAARRDDLFDHMVPSDVRQLVGEIERLRDGLAQIASGPCCGTEGCDVDDPKCDAMLARATLHG